MHSSQDRLYPPTRSRIHRCELALEEIRGDVATGTEAEEELLRLIDHLR